MMKQSQISIITILLIGIFSTSICFSQPKKAPEFSYEIEWDSERTAFNLTIYIEKGTPEYTVELFDKEPWDDGKILSARRNVTDNTIIFSNVNAQDIYIQVYDATTLKNVKYLKINE
jgi:hypothetical protein